MPGDWTREEVEAVVADYLAMWFDERAGRPVNKTEHRRLLKPLLQNRNDGSIERKHQNTSAILLELWASQQLTATSRWATTSVSWAKS